MRNRISIFSNLSFLGVQRIGIQAFEVLLFLLTLLLSLYDTSIGKTILCLYNS